MTTDTTKKLGLINPPINQPLKFDGRVQSAHRLIKQINEQVHANRLALAGKNHSYEKLLNIAAYSIASQTAFLEEMLFLQEFSDPEKTNPAFRSLIELMKPAVASDMSNEDPAFAIALIKKWADSGKKHNAAQKEKAKKPRGKLDIGYGEDEAMTITRVIGKLAMCHEFKEDTARELWSRFYGILDDDLQLAPEVIEHLDWKKSTYKYDYKDGRKSITGGHFSDVVGEYRTEKKKKRISRANDISCGVCEMLKRSKAH